MVQINQHKRTDVSIFMNRKFYHRKIPFWWAPEVSWSRVIFSLYEYYYFISGHGYLPRGHLFSSVEEFALECDLITVIYIWVTRHKYGTSRFLSLGYVTRDFWWFYPYDNRTPAGRRTPDWDLFEAEEPSQVSYFLPEEPERVELLWIHERVY